MQRPPLLPLVWLWLTRHEHQVQQWWAVCLTQPRVAAMRRRALPLVRFMQARLSPEGALGLHLTLGALILMGTSWVFGGIVEDILTHDPLTVIDSNVAQWLHAHATPPVTTAMLAISLLGSFRMVAAIALCTALLLVWRRRWYRLLALVLTVPGGAVLNGLLKSAFRRGRPMLAQ